MGEALAIVAAMAFALGSVLQQKGTIETEATEDDPRFLIQILHKPIWLAGAISQAVGWVLQAAALDRASLMVVQALATVGAEDRRAGTGTGFEQLRLVIRERRSRHCPIRGDPLQERRCQRWLGLHRIGDSH